MSSVEPQVGMVLARYRLDRLLGEGGMGSVWAATHVVTRKPVAIKLIKGSVTGDSQLLRRFMREARAASAVRHANVVQIHDIVQLEDGLPMMVMDLLEGESLGQRLAREQKVPLGELATILCPVISAVGTAHAAGIVHRDLKPDNIFLARLPDGTVDPRVLDFGIAKLSAAEGIAERTSDLTATGAMLGTPCYMAPEQAFGEKDVDQRVDVWAMGVILYECLAGKRPVDGSNFGQVLKVIMTGAIVPFENVAPDLPRNITTLVGRMLTIDRTVRCNDLREAYETLSPYARPGTLRSSPFSRPAPVVTVESEPGASVSTDPFAKTEHASGATSRRASRWPIWAGVGVVGAGALFIGSYATRGQGPMGLGGTPSALPDGSAALRVLPPVETATAVPSALAAPSAVAGAAAVASVAAVSDAGPPRAVGVIHKNPTTRREPETPSTVSTRQSEGPTAPPTASTPERIHGVVVKPPF